MVFNRSVMKSFSACGFIESRKTIVVLSIYYDIDMLVYKNIYLGN